jgi:hypothetical protein
MPAPHRIIDGVVNGIADGVNKLGNSLLGTVTSAGHEVMNALDKPVAQVTKKQGPHRAVDKALDGAAAALQNVGQSGVVGSLKTVGEGVMKALDHPVDQFGIPPKDIGLGKLRGK